MHFQGGFSDQCLVGLGCFTAICRSKIEVEIRRVLDFPPATWLVYQDCTEYRWWFQRFFIFTPKFWEMIQFDLLWISLHELMVTCGCTVLDSDSPCLVAQGWDSIDPTLLRTQPEKVAHVFGIGSELRVLLLELELPQLFSSHW